MKRFQTTILMLTFLILFGCEGFGNSAKVGEPFTLKPNESANVRGTGIEVTLDRLGRKWLANGGGESVDFVYTVKFNGQIQNFPEDMSDGFRVGKYKIGVVKADPFGDGSATFIVTKR